MAVSETRSARFMKRSQQTKTKVAVTVQRPRRGASNGRPVVQGKVNSRSAPRGLRQDRVVAPSLLVADRQLLDHLPVGLVCLDGAGRFVWGNSVASRMLGLPPETMAERDCLSIQQQMRREDGQAGTVEDQTIAACLRSDRSQPGRVMRFVRADGSVVWISIAVISLREIFGQREAGVLVSLEDVTARKRLELALRENEILHRGTFEAMEMGLIRVSASGQIIWANQMALDLLRLTQDRVIGRPVVELQERMKPPADQAVPLGEHPFCRCLSTAHPQPPAIWELRHEDDTTSRVKIAVCPVPASDPSRPGGAVLALFDVTQQYRTELALRESEDRFRRVINSDVVGIVFWDADGKIRDANKAFLDMLGYAREELLAGCVRWRDLTPPEYARPDERCLEELRAKGVCGSFEQECLRRDGSRVPVTISGAALDGSADRGVAFVLDVTRRRNAERELRASEARLRLLAEQMPAVLWTVDQHLRFTSSLGAGLAALNLRPGQVVGRTLYDYFGTDDPKFQPIAASLRALQGEAFGYEFTWQGRTYHITVEPFRSSGEEIDGCIGFATDITERKRIEEQLIFREKRMRALIENSSDGIELVDAQGEILFESPSVQRLFGYFSPSMVGRKLFEFIHPDDSPKLRRRFEEVCGAGGTGAEACYRFRHRDGTWHWVEASLNNMLEEPGVLAIIINYRDITERHHAEEERDRLFQEIQTARHRLEQLSRRLVEVQEAERRSLARDLHDEIGQQLTAMKLLLESHDGLSPEQTRQRMQEAHARTSQLQGHVRNMSLDLRPTMLDDLGLVPALLWHFDRRSGRVNLNVQFRHQGVEDQRFPAAVETAAYRIVQEALTNVARHSGVNEAVVRLWANPETLSVQIEDKGCGFDVEAMLAGSTSSGLSGMRERAAILGGRLTLESSPKEGTVLTAELPLRTAADQTTTP
jgi:PAS domain S-box-containing protein